MRKQQQLFYGIIENTMSRSLEILNRVDSILPGGRERVKIRTLKDAAKEQMYNSGAFEVMYHLARERTLKDPSKPDTSVLLQDHNMGGGFSYAQALQLSWGMSGYDRQVPSSSSIRVLTYPIGSTYVFHTMGLWREIDYEAVDIALHANQGNEFGRLLADLIARGDRLKERSGELFDLGQKVESEAVLNRARRLDLELRARVAMSVARQGSDFRYSPSGEWGTRIRTRGSSLTLTGSDFVRTPRFPYGK